jgi:uncharacterized integral membrane protein
MKPKTIIVVILIVLALVIILQNTEVVTLRFLFWDLAMSRIILIPLLMLVGCVLGYIGATMWGNR